MKTSTKIIITNKTPETLSDEEALKLVLQLVKMGKTGRDKERKKYPGAEFSNRGLIVKTFHRNEGVHTFEIEDDGEEL